MTEEPRLYSELASWWHLFSAPADYAEEAESFVRLLDPIAPGARPTMLELGSGGGNLASHIKTHFALTLSDRSRAMLEASRTINPELEHVEGDMRALRLGRLFDAVLIHDAIMYCTTEGDVRAALATAAVHCRAGGQVLIAPDCVLETCEAETTSGGEDGADGRSVRYLEWSLPRVGDAVTFEVFYAIVRREANGEARVDLDRHINAAFPEQSWLEWMADAGIPAQSTVDAWKRHVFVGRRAG
ncbi:MAG: class I SAM-dependent methyltransferase [Cytophagaceae bacterium]|nr:class I SAM-dependent methyltransferase [Gemmatimonadaceae bacterium]